MENGIAQKDQTSWEKGLSYLAQKPYLLIFLAIAFPLPAFLISLRVGGIPSLILLGISALSLTLLIVVILQIMVVCMRVEDAFREKKQWKGTLIALLINGVTMSILVTISVARANHMVSSLTNIIVWVVVVLINSVLFYKHYVLKKYSHDERKKQTANVFVYVVCEVLALVALLIMLFLSMSPFVRDEEFHDTYNAIYRHFSEDQASRLLKNRRELKRR